MIDDLWDQSAIIQQMRAASEQEGEEKGKIKGKTEAFQRAIIDAIQIRFPSLLDIAQRTVQSINDVEKLHQLYIQVLTASNEKNAQTLFSAKQVG